MKKFMSYIAVAALLVTFTACGNKEVSNNEKLGNGETINNEETLNNQTPEINNENKVEENKPVENKPVENKPVENKPVENKPVENKPVENKPVENKPVENEPVESKPVEDKPIELPKEETVGKVLLRDFEARAASASSMVELGEAIVNNPIIPAEMMKMSIEVEEGYLAGIGEIKGFKSAAMFGPAISSIPFIGYVFELENVADVPAFKTLLENNADLNWNWCTSADEAVIGSVDNKVFIVMAKFSFEEPEVPAEDI